MEKTPAPETSPYPAIDYDHIDAAALNEQIRKIAAAQTAPANLSAPPAAPFAAPTASPPLTPQSPASSPVSAPQASFKVKLKGRLRRLLVPFFPLLRVLSLPAHEELGAVIRSLDETNRRVDHLNQLLDRRLEDLDRSIEYVKLLHMLGHNLVVETTKLRIEHDDLKSQLRLLEKDLEFLTRRERAVERRILP
jgi:hypothetical protein